MLDRRPFWGLIVWLYLCVIIWLFTAQEPVMTEAETAIAGITIIQQQQQQQQQQNYAGNVKQLLAVQQLPTLSDAAASLTSSVSTLISSNNSSSSSTTTTTTHTAVNASHVVAAAAAAHLKDISNLNLNPNRYRYQIDETSRQYAHRLNNSINKLVLNKNKNVTTSSSSSTSASASASAIWSAIGLTPSTPLQHKPDDVHQLIDLHNFDYLLIQTPCAPHIQALILVHTAPRNHEKRMVIRETWGNASYLAQSPLRLLFLLGAVNDNATLQWQLERENMLYNDMVQGTFNDDYRNMTYKHVMALKWFHYNCAHAQILIKVDDDVYVNTPQLLKYAQQQQQQPVAAAAEGGNITYTPTTTIKTERDNYTIDTPTAAVHSLFQHPRQLLFCQQFVGSRVKRSYRSKWRVSFKEYGERYYPPYCPGYAIIYSADVVQRLYEAAQQTHYFWIDDVHITGVLAQRTNLTITTLQPYVLFSGNCVSLLEHHLPRDSIEFLFSWHSIQPAQIRALWQLYATQQEESNQLDFANR